MKVLITPWGNPFEWKETTYVCNDFERVSVCTLPIIKEKVEPDVIIIIVLDTLANYTKNNPIPQRDFSKYDEVEEDVRERVNYFIENKLRYDPKDMELVIAPGVGVFNNVRVEGNLLDFYHYIVFKLAELLPTEDMTIYLDLTHGINFMPVLTYKAVTDLLSLASYTKNIRLVVLNSEPFPLGLPQEEVKKAKLKLRLVERNEVRPKQNLNVLRDKNYDKWNAFISSIANGFPLVFATFYPKIEEVKIEIENRLKMFRDGISVNGSTVVRENELCLDFKILSELYYLLRTLNTTFKDLPKQEVELKELKRISEILFNKLPRIGIVVEEQIKFLEDRLTTNGRPKRYVTMRASSFMPLSELIQSGGLSGSDDGGRKVRNFIAHSGFEYNVTMVKVDNGGRLIFKYKSKGKVKSYAVESMRYRWVTEDEVPK